MISSGESSSGQLPSFVRPSPPLHYHSSPHLPLNSPPLESTISGRMRHAGLRIDTSASNSQASSSTASPVRDFSRPNRHSLKRKPVRNEATVYLSQYRLGPDEVAGIREDGPVLSSLSLTSPVDVPQPASTCADELEGKGSLSTSDTSSSLQTRSTSISFSPLVTLDSGRQIPTETPLPKPNVQRRSRGRSMLQELANSIETRPPVRAHSESERSQYDPVTGEFIADRHHIDPSLRRHANLQSNSENVSPQTETAIIEREAPVPVADMRTFLSPVSADSPCYPTSFENTSAWPPNRRFDGSQRTRSFNFEPRRRSSRAFSGASSSSQSPASAFLRGFESANSARDPDSEGEHVGGYVLGKQIGFGGTSIVREATHVETSERQAVKIVRKRIHGRDDAENDKLQAEFEHEVEIWRKLQHKNILSLISVWVTPFATFCFMKLVLSKSLFDLVRHNRKGIDGHFVQRYSYQLASAIRYLHEKKQIVHHDIKLENCLLDMSGPNAEVDGGNILLCDFGMSEYIDDDAPRNPHRHNELLEMNPDRLNLRSVGPSEASTSIVGSLQYAAPEVIETPDNIITSAVDLWAFGVVVYALFVGSLPFQDPFQPRVVVAILGGDWSQEKLRQSKGIVGIEEHAVTLIQGCLDMDPEVRLTIGQVMDNEWIYEYGRRTAML